jgi:uncharacterized C2H2 Zn-finger protein
VKQSIYPIRVGEEITSLANLNGTRDEYCVKSIFSMNINNLLLSEEESDSYCLKANKRPIDGSNEIIQLSKKFNFSFNKINNSATCLYPNCGKVIKNRSNLSRHAQLHLGSTLFKCALCGNTYTRKDTMKAHQKKFHSYGLSKIIN